MVTEVQKLAVVAWAMPSAERCDRDMHLSIHGERRGHISSDYIACVAGSGRAGR